MLPGRVGRRPVSWLPPCAPSPWLGEKPRDRRGERRRRARASRPVSSRPPCSAASSFRDGMPDLDGEHIAGARVFCDRRDGLLLRGGKPTNETEDASSPAAALLAGDASGPAQLAGAVAPPATLGFLLCSGLAVAGPRARPSRAYRFSARAPWRGITSFVGRRSSLRMLDG